MTKYRFLYQLTSVTVFCTACAGSEGEDANHNIELVQRFMAGMDSGDFGVIEEVMCPDLVAQLAGDTLMRDDLTNHVRGAYAAFPDFRHGIEDLFAAGDKVVLRATDRATHAESGRRVMFGQISVYQVTGGCISRFWEEYDQHRMLQQLATEGEIGN